MLTLVVALSSFVARPAPLAARLAPSAAPARMMAEGGPPDIDWQDGTLVANVELGRGTKMLTVKAAAPVDYLPGHILGLEVAHESGEPRKGPYTVTRCDGPTFDIVYRVIPDGRKTPTMASWAEGEPCRFGGRFGTPIAEGISAGATRVVGLATGAGIGPLVGYAEAALASADGPARIELFGGFRDVADVVLGDECEAMRAAHPERFGWGASISQPAPCAAVSLHPVAGERLSGRLTSTLPGLGGGALGTTHFHLIGNGAFVKEMQAGLLGGGVAEERVTTEVYFNGKAEPNEDVVAFVADAVRKAAAELAEAPPAAAEPTLAPKPEMFTDALTGEAAERLRPVNDVRRAPKREPIRTRK